MFYCLSAAAALSVLAFLSAAGANGGLITAAAAAFAIAFCVAAVLDHAEKHENPRPARRR